MVRAAIVCGGRATRMGSICESTPKALLPVGGLPLLAHQLHLLAAAEVREITVLAGQDRLPFETFLAGDEPSDLQVDIVTEGSPRGSGGCLFAAPRDRTLVVLLGDVMAHMDLAALLATHRQTGADVSLVVHPNDHLMDSDLADHDERGRIHRILRKPHPPALVTRNAAVAGVFVFEPSFWRFAVARAGCVDLVHDLIAGGIEGGAYAHAYPSAEYLKDMGTPPRYEQVQADHRSGRIHACHRAQPRPAAFLDRDGTLNRHVGHIRRPEQIELLAQAARAVRRLNQAGILTVLVTNQPVVARGECDEADLRRIHAYLETSLGREGAYLDAVYVCPHHPDAGFPGEVGALKIPCTCRKPETGMIEAAVRDLNIDLASSAVFGDTWRDMKLAARVGIPAYLVGDGLSLDDAVSAWLAWGSSCALQASNDGGATCSP